jgi:hypothetical protein
LASDRDRQPKHWVKPRVFVFVNPVKLAFLNSDAPQVVFIAVNLDTEPPPASTLAPEWRKLHHMHATTSSASLAIGQIGVRFVPQVGSLGLLRFSPTIRLEISVPLSR